MIKGLIYIPVKWVEFVSNYELNHTNTSCEKRERQMDGLIKERQLCMSSRVALVEFKDWPRVACYKVRKYVNKAGNTAQLDRVDLLLENVDEQVKANILNVFKIKKQDKEEAAA